MSEVVAIVNASTENFIIWVKQNEVKVKIAKTYSHVVEAKV